MAATTLQGALNRRQGPTLGFQELHTQLLPVQSGLRRREGGRLGQGSLGIDVEIAVVRVLLAKVVAGMDLGFVPGEDSAEAAR